MPDTNVASFIVEDGIPLPPSRRHSGRKKTALRAACEALQPGQSIATSLRQKDLGRLAGFCAKATGKKYTTRKMPDGRARIWCIADRDSE